MHCGVRANTVKCVKCPSFDVQSMKQFSICFFGYFPCCVLISPRIFLSCLGPHPSPLIHCLRLCLSLRLSPTRLSAGREYSCQLIDPVEIDS